MLVRWESKPKIVVDEPQDNKRDVSPIRSSSPIVSRLRDLPEPPSPAPREILHQRNKDEKLAASKEKLAASKEKLAASKEKLMKEDKTKDKKDEKNDLRNLKEEKHAKKDKKKDKENKFKDVNDENHLSSERIIIGGEDAVKNAANSKSRLPHEVLNQFEGKSREVNIETEKYFLSSLILSSYFYTEICNHQISVFYSKSNISLAGSNRTGIASADASHGKEQETQRFGRLYRCLAVTRN